MNSVLPLKAKVRQSGFTLIEAMIVAAVLVPILFSIVNYYTSAPFSR